MSTTNGSTSISNMTMHLFGAPYQFTDITDPRVSNINTKIGYNYVNDILLDAPICTIIPGKGIYMKGKDNKTKQTTTSTLLGALQGNSSTLDIAELLKNENNNFRLYEFESDYTNYINYVNVLARSGATFLGLESTKGPDGSTTLGTYNWAKYKFDAAKEKNVSVGTNVGTKLSSLFSSLSSIISNATSGDTSDNGSIDPDSNEQLTNMLTNKNYVQFYIEPLDASDNFTNSYEENSLTSLVKQAASTMKSGKQIADLTGANISGTIDSVSSTLQSGLESIVGDSSTADAVINTLSGVAANTIKGYNLIVPKVYGSSDYSRSYSINIKLDTPYGTPLGFFYDIWLPLCFIFASSLPKNAQGYMSAPPFLVKAYVEGVFSINLGAVSSLQITKNASSTMNVNKLPNSVSVTINFDDLYNDLMISSSTSAFDFINNSSLIEYIASSCGISLSESQLTNKIKLGVNTVLNSITDTPTNITSRINESIDSIVSSWVGLK